MRWSTVYLPYAIYHLPPNYMCMGLVIDYTIAVRVLVTLYISYTTTDDKISTKRNNEMVFSWVFEGLCGVSSRD